MRDIEEVLINFLAGYGITGTRVEGKTGVFVGHDKIASIGVAAKQWTSYHGFAINIKKDISVFDTIIPCGLQGVKATSVEILLKKNIEMKDAYEGITEEFKEVFQN